MHGTKNPVPVRARDAEVLANLHLDAPLWASVAVNPRRCTPTQGLCKSRSGFIQQRRMQKVRNRCELPCFSSCTSAELAAIVLVVWLRRLDVALNRGQISG